MECVKQIRNPPSSIIVILTDYFPPKRFVVVQLFGVNNAYFSIPLVKSHRGVHYTTDLWTLVTSDRS